MTNSINSRWIVIVIAVAIWFVLFPDDLQPVRQILSLTQSFSIGVYILFATVLVCWTWKSVSTSGKES